MEMHLLRDGENMTLLEAEKYLQWYADFCNISELTEATNIVLKEITNLENKVNDLKSELKEMAYVHGEGSYEKGMI
jgi:SepF-like predicted cell division protein (DUF552 family)